MKNKNNNRQVILITGASSDIGCEVIRQLVSGKSDEFSNAVYLAHANSGVKKLNDLGKALNLKDRLQVIQTDLTVETELGKLIQIVREEHQFPTHIVHLAAGRLELKRPVEFNWQSYLTDFEIQLRSIGLILQAFLPDMAKSELRCKVIFMLSSTTIGAPPKFMSQYIVMKYALLGFLRSLAVEYAEANICFNAVSPSMVETQFLMNLPGKFIEMAAAANPRKSNADIGDVVPIIRFLLSQDSDYISGANIPVTAASIL